MILKIISTEKKQKDWANYIPTVGFVLHSSMHHLTNYKPLMHLIGRKPKLPSEIKQCDQDVPKNLDFTEEEVKMLLQFVTEHKFHNLVKM